MRFKPTLLVAGVLMSMGAVSAPAPAATPGVEAPPSEMLKIRDPFRRPEIKSEFVPKTELEMFPLDQIHMLGVVTGPDHLRAMITGPNGKTYFVAERTKIGVRQGVVTKITAERMRVREKIVNVLGQEESVDTDLQLPSERRGGDGNALGNPNGNPNGSSQGNR